MKGKKGIKDYHKKGKKIKNPFVKQKKYRGYWKKVLFSLAVAGIVIILGWWLFFSGFWNIQKIEVNGVSRIPEEEIKKIARGQIEKEHIFIDPKNLFFCKKEELKKELNNRYHFPEIRINKNIPDKLTITIKENQKEYILKENEKYYKIDTNNYIIESSGEGYSGENIPIIKNEGEQSVVTGDKCYVERGYIDFIVDFYNILDQKSEEIKIKNFLIGEGVDENTVKLNIEGGPLLYLNTDSYPEFQIDKLLLLKEEELQEDFWSKEYIRLEYGDRIFYK